MLKLNGTFLNSKVARRIFMLFIVSALIPIVVLAFFSYRQINIFTTENVEEHLRQDAKNYGLMIYDKLTLFSEKLAIKEKAIDNGAFSLELESTDRDFSDFFLVSLEGNNDQIKKRFPAISNAEIDFLRRGEFLITITNPPTSNTKIFLLKKLINSEKIIVGQIKNEALWGEIDIFSANKEFCAYSAENTLLYCSSGTMDAQLKKVQDLWMEKSTGNIELHDDTNHYLIGYWSLFLQPKYLYPNFTIVIAYNQAVALQPIIHLRNIFIVISLFTLVTISFLSTLQIRRYLTPLEDLMNGIKRISNNKFDQPVHVSTDDEFNQLADSFNWMSKRISQQFKFLTTLSDIDQSILASTTIKDVIKTIITRGNNAAQSQSISIAMINENNSELLEVYSMENQQEHNIAEYTHKILENEKISILCKKTQTWQVSDIDMPAFLTPLKQKELTLLILVPVISENKLIAILIFAFNESNISLESHARLREIGDRFAIALEKSAWEKQLYFQAHYDPLTKLPNRQLLNDRLQQAINRAQRDQLTFPMLFLDLDRFKTINDSLGHSSGDKLISMVAKRLLSTTREDDTVARLGGDEFVILLSTPNHQNEIYSLVTKLAKKIFHSLSSPFTIENHKIHITSSIGIVIFPNDGKDIEALMKNADSAMYHAKAEGRNNFKCYSSDLNAQAMHTLVMENNLHQALTKNEFELHYQPKVDTKTGEILGAEALIRWRHPSQGLIRPDQFIPIAESSGIIGKIGEWSLYEACRQNKLWQDQGLKKIKISVNLSPKQFQQENLIGLIEGILISTELLPKYLDLEIIEGTAMHDINQTIASLHQLKKLGLSISIDDYGTGYSTLSYIKKFPVDTLKIDMSFIRNLVSNYGDKAIVSSTILLAHKLNLSIVAEGVEDAAQLAILNELGCNEIQGYYFSPPLQAEEFRHLLIKKFITP